MKRSTALVRVASVAHDESAPKRGEYYLYVTQQRRLERMRIALHSPEAPIDKQNPLTRKWDFARTVILDLMIASN
jgi:hypothetical protein